MAYLTFAYLALKPTSKCPYKQTLLSGDTRHSCDTSSQCQGTEAEIKDLLKAARHFRGGKKMLEGGGGWGVELITCCTDKP